MRNRPFAYLLIAVALTSCGRTTPTETNLLKNPSFEDVKDGLPVGWKINNFRGLADMKEATYRMNERQVHDGKYSFHFYAEEDAKRFFTLSQTVEVKGAKNIRVRAWIKTVGVEKNADQYPQAGIGLTFYNKFRGRFDSRTFADVRTEPRYGTTDGWELVDTVFRLPLNTAYVELHCVLGMSGRMWFDELSLDVPEALNWREVPGELFTHYWLDGTPYPEGSIDFQEKIYNLYAVRLGVAPELIPKVSYYYYPSIDMFHDVLGVKGGVKVDYQRREIHSTHPADDHEIVHLLTDVFGRLPRVLGEGTAYYLMDHYNNKPIQPQAQKILLANKLPTLRNVLDPMATKSLPPENLVPAVASFVGYLLEFGGAARFQELHRQSDVDMDYEQFAQAFAAAYDGGSLEDAEKAWRATLASADFSRFEQKQEKKEGQTDDDG